MVKADKFAPFHLPEKCPEKSLTYSYMWAGTAAKDIHEILAVLCHLPGGRHCCCLWLIPGRPNTVFSQPISTGEKTKKKESNKALNTEDFLGACSWGGTILLFGPQLLYLLPGQTPLCRDSRTQMSLCAVALMSICLSAEILAL